MTRLRVQFLLFFILLAGAAGFLLFNSYQQMESEEQRIWQAASEKVFNQMQAVVSDFLTIEDHRPPAEYQSPTSPLTTLQANDPRGLIGYFQLAPGGQFTTPQRHLKGQLEDLTSSLKLPTIFPSRSKGVVELGRLDDAVKPMERVMSDRPGSSTGGYRSAQNVYPNPVQEQALLLEKKKMRAAKKAPVTASKSAEFAPKMEETPPVIAAISPRPPPPSSVVADADLIPEASTNPFQARLISDQYLLFYRKAWIDQRPHIQGFVVELERFFSWLMDQSFANSDLTDFANARLDLGDRTLAQYGVAKADPNRSRSLFERSLGYPLNPFTWRVEAAHLPRLAGRLFLNLLTATVFSLVTFGLFFIYRSAAAQILLSQKRQDFVSAVTHELKTPLTSIRMYSEMLEDGWAKDDDKKREYYGQISRESSRLSRLIENVLQLARLEKKTYKVNLKVADPGPDFVETLAELKKIAETNGFSLSLQTATNLPPVSYDPEAIKQIILSLLDNSIKFGSESIDKSLEIILVEEERQVVLSFRDRGPGIPHKELEKVFHNFHRVENEMTRKTKGTGIGLAMCRMLTQAMGAKIDAKNRTGGGLEVRILFSACYSPPGPLG